MFKGSLKKHEEGWSRMKILVGDLSPDVSQEFLQKTFQIYGTVSSVSITVDSTTNETIGELEMPDADEASNAVTLIDGNRIEGQVITIINKSEFGGDENSQLIPEEDTGAESPIEKRINDERRVIDSPLFKSDQGIVIDRRDYTDRRDNPDTRDDNNPPSEVI